MPFDVEAFNILNNAVIVYDTDLRVVYINKVGSELFGVTPDCAIGQFLENLFSDETLAQNQTQAEPKLGKNCFNIKSSGQRLIAYTSLSPFNDASGKKRGTVLTIHKIPENHENHVIDLKDSTELPIDLSRQELVNIIDAEALQSMMNDLYAVTKIGFAIIDLKGNVLASAGWQNICLKFHRTNPQTLWNCLESDLVLTEGVAQGEFKTYKCKNNMWDIVTPIIVDNRHVGNLFSGQFFFDDEVIDRALFVDQAERFGFDKQAYLAALDEVPRWNRAVVTNLMRFYAKLSEMVSRLSYSNLRLSKALSNQRQIEKELRQKHHDLNHAQSVAKTGSWRLNIQKNELLWSDETYRMFEVPLGTPLTFEHFLAMVYPEDQELVDRSWKAALRGEGYDVIHRVLINGNILWLHEKAELEFAEDGTLVAGFGTVQDITEHKNDEQKLRRLNRAMRAISNANQVLMRATDEAAFLQQGCRIIVEDCGYTMVWIGFAEQDEAKSVKPMAYAGFDKGYIDSLNITWADSERGRGPTGSAIRTGKVQICADMHNNPRFAPWRAQALERGYVSSIVLPLLYEDKAFGALNIYSKEKNPFSDADELKLLVELASDFSHGITLLRMRAKAKQAEEALRLSEERFSKAFNQSPAAISISCLSDGKYVDVNQTFLDLLGYDRAEVIGRDSVELSVFANPNASKEFPEVFASGKSFNNIEMTFKTKSGKLLPTITSIEKISINNADHIITTFVDITRRKQAEAQLSRAKAEWEQTFDALPDLITVIDNNHRILRVNRAMAESLGVKAEMCVGKPCYECVHLADVSPTLCPHTQTLQDGKEHVAQLCEERLGGEIMVSTSPLKDETGKVFASVHVIRRMKRLHE